MYALPLSAKLQNFSNLYKKLISPIKIPVIVDKLAPLAPDINVHYFSLTGGEGKTYDQLIDKNTFNISFYPRPNIYKVSVSEQRLHFTPLQPSLRAERWWQIEVWDKAEQIQALDLEHPVIKWTDKLKRQFTASDTDPKDKIVRMSGILMGTNETPPSMNSLPVLEGNHIQDEVGKPNSNEDSDDSMMNECMEPPKVEDDFIPHQLKAKRRRASLPNRFKMDDRQSIVLHTWDGRSDFEKLKSVIRKLQQIHTTEELEFLCRVC